MAQTSPALSRTLDQRIKCVYSVGVARRNRERRGRALSGRRTGEGNSRAAFVAWSLNRFQPRRVRGPTSQWHHMLACIIKGRAFFKNVGIWKRNYLGNGPPPGKRHVGARSLRRLMLPRNMYICLRYTGGGAGTAATSLQPVTAAFRSDKQLAGSRRMTGELGTCLSVYLAVGGDDIRRYVSCPTLSLVARERRRRPPVWCRAWHMRVACHFWPLNRSDTALSGVWHYIAYWLRQAALFLGRPFTLVELRGAILRSAAMRGARVRWTVCGLM